MSVETAVEIIISSVIEAEGGDRYTNDPHDPGGPTKFGITLKVLREWRRDPNLPASEVQNLTEAEARRVYYDRYVVQPGYTQVLALSIVLGAKVIDIGVNCGIDRASRWLQIALNSMNRSARATPDYPELTVDGHFGPAGVRALSALFSIRGIGLAERVMFRAMDCQQGAHYLSLGSSDAKFEDYMFGWFAKRIGS